MLPRLWCSLVLAAIGCRLSAQSPIQRLGPIDSIVLVRTSAWPCSTCAPERVTVRREVTDTTALAAFGRKSDSLGFYRLPANVMGASFCRVVKSDALLATLSIHRPDGSWSVRGYHHCRDRSPEQTGLLALEALVDSLAARAPRRPF
jgi:hypothetical protein